MFCPDGYVTRGQMAAFLVRALDLTDDGGGNKFIDDDGSVFEADIAKLAAAGITRGCNPPENTMFCPDGYVTRGQMAAFLVRALDLTDDGGGNKFIDDDGSVFEADIAKLAAAGITRGCNPPENTMFCPASRVSRGQMAAFLYRALYRPVVIVTQTLADAVLGLPYRAQLEATGGEGMLYWAVSQGQLPTGLRLADDGVIWGTPTKTGDETFSVLAYDGMSNSTSRSLTLPVKGTLRASVGSSTSQEATGDSEGGLDLAGGLSDCLLVRGSRPGFRRQQRRGRRIRAEPAERTDDPGVGGQQRCHW